MGLAAAEVECSSANFQKMHLTLCVELVEHVSPWNATAGRKTKFNWSKHCAASAIVIDRRALNNNAELLSITQNKSGTYPTFMTITDVLENLVDDGRQLLHITCLSKTFTDGLVVSARVRQV